MVLLAMLTGFVGYTMLYSVFQAHNWQFWRLWMPNRGA